VLSTNGDLTAIRSGGTTGVIYLGNSGSRYLYYDGTNYQMPSSNLYINGAQAVTNSGSWSITSANTNSISNVLGISYTWTANQFFSYLGVTTNSTGDAYVGMSLTNAYNGGAGVSYIDSQGRSAVTDSNWFITHNADYSSYMSWATQVAGTNTDRRVQRLILASDGSIYPGVDNAQLCGINGLRWSAVWAANGTIQTSDAREKNSVEDSVLGLNFITKLRPVSYKWNVGGRIADANNTKDENGDPVFNTTTTDVPGQRRHFGLIAQEVKAVLPDGVDFGGWVLTDKDDQNSQQALRYDQFISPLIKAVQEQQQMIEELKQRIQTLEAKP
jgi:hypothetical protein